MKRRKRRGSPNHGVCKRKEKKTKGTPAERGKKSSEKKGGLERQVGERKTGSEQPL